MDKEELSNLKKAGSIAREAVAYARAIIKPGMKLSKIAEKIEGKIIELGGKPAFPVNLSTNEIAAHYTPSYNDDQVARGLLKVDIGVSVDGYIADTAFSLDLEKSKENKELIEASEEALKNAINSIKRNIEVSEIGKIIQETVSSHNFSPIINLSGHELKQYVVHAGLTIPNHNNFSKVKLKEGVYAIEPFATTGSGEVYEGKPSGIYALIEGNIRDSFAREILKYIEQEYKTLPFCSRWLVKKFGTRALLALSLLEKARVIKQYEQLIEKSRKKVSQAENTVIIYDNKIEVLV